LAILFVAVVATAQLGSQLLVRRNRQLARMTARLAALAETDGLTGAYNHRHFYKELEKEIDASSRYGRHTSLIMADLDFFKRVNDTYGHPVGDIVLRESAVAMSSTLRATDTLARYGGEEFAILLPETDERHAVEVAERLRAAIGAIIVPAGDHEVTITASFGVAEFPGAALDPASLVAAADSALYYSKKNGRDQVCAFSNLSAGTVDRADVDEFFARLENAGVFTVQALAAAVMGGADEPGRPSGSVHLARVASGALGLGERDSETLEIAASVYDVGKLTIPGRILEKRSALTREEAEVIREHPEASERILSAVGDLERILKVVRYHHEHFDGSGYPDGLRGEEIPYLARVLLVIDAFNAMIAPRSYREAMTPEAAVAELRRHAGTQFDPEVVEKLAAKLLDPTTSTRTLAA
ncbi:MAG: diguanylate cyclase, partial [Dehalococcoidia bacterium]